MLVFTPLSCTAVYAPLTSSLSLLRCGGFIMKLVLCAKVFNKSKRAEDEANILAMKIPESGEILWRFFLCALIAQFFYFFLCACFYKLPAVVLFSAPNTFITFPLFCHKNISFKRKGIRCFSHNFELLEADAAVTVALY